MISVEHKNYLFSDILPLRLTLILLLFYGAQGWQIEIPMRILCGAALVYAPLAISSTFWLLITSIYVLIHSTDWFYIDNHKYLIGCLCLAWVVALTSRNPTQLMRSNARWLLAVCFTLATVWKVIGGEYFDGSFLHFKFLTDSRLELPASIVSGLDRGVFEYNRSLVGFLSLNPTEGVSVDLNTNSRLRLVTLLMSYWTLAIEGAIAVLFFLPTSRKVVGARSVVLLIFVCTTYFLLPVSGFAFALAVAGFVQLPEGWRKMRIAFLTALLLIELTHIPWQILATPSPI